MCILCLVLDCGHPGNITNGTVHVSETTLGERIHYRCDEGYILNGSSWRTCQFNGIWDGDEPTCEGEYHFGRNHINCYCIIVRKLILHNHTVLMTCPQLDIEHGSVIVTKVSVSTKWHHARYTCDVGYEMRGWSYRDCSLLTGEWEGTAPTCEECK